LIKITAAGLQKAQRVKSFIEDLSHTQGEWVGKPFLLLPWQWKEVILPLFGTLRPDGRRRYRFCYVEIPKKNGKTPLSAAVGLYMLCADKEASPEVYLAAGDREQAGYIYRYAAHMAQANPTLNKTLKVLDSRKRIINHRNNGFMQVLSSESYTKHGINPSCIIFDELHAQPNDDLWNTLTSGTDTARRQQLVLVLSTAGIFNKESIWWRTREKARQIRDGIIRQENFLPVLYIADPDPKIDNPEDEKVWKRVNPSMGHIFSLEKIREHFQEAKQDPVEYQNFLRFRLNIPVKSIFRWLPMEAWEKCNGKVDPETLKGRPCYGGLDLSSKLDLTSFELEFPPAAEGEKIQILSRFYVPEDTIMKRSKQDKVHYDIWAKEGFIVPTPGNVIDEAFIKKDIIEASKNFELRELGYDPWGATSLATQLLNDHGIQMVEMRQGAKTLSEPAKDLLTKIMKGEVNHGSHPVLRWCADNLVMVKDANENVRPDKEKATDRIDGMVALIMAHGRAMFRAQPPEPKYQMMFLGAGPG
jgi:phage terminase large subunit-like protein